MGRLIDGHPFGGIGDIFESFFGSGFTQSRRRTGPVQGQIWRHLYNLHSMRQCSGVRGKIRTASRVILVKLQEPLRGQIEILAVFVGLDRSNKLDSHLGQ